MIKHKWIMSLRLLVAALEVGTLVACKTEADQASSASKHPQHPSIYGIYGNVSRRQRHHSSENHRATRCVHRGSKDVRRVSRCPILRPL